MLCTSATAFCALLIRPLPASWVIAPTVAAGASIVLFRSPCGNRESNDPADCSRAKLSAFLISAFLAFVFSTVWLRTMRVISLQFFDWKAAFPVLSAAVVCAFLAVPFIDRLLKALSGPMKERTDRFPDCKGLKLSGEDNRLLICTAIAAVSICSMSSPLYPFNDWVDANCFFTVGKSILHGLVPYRDLYEQKGPILYALYALPYMASHTSFFGVWLLEIASAAAFLRLSLQCFFYLTGKKSPLFLLLTAAIVYTAPSFLKGGSAEEFCLPLLMAALCIGMRTLKEEREISVKEGFLIGLTSGAVLWIKYSMLGFYLGFIIIPAWRMIRRGRVWSLMKFLFSILAGVVLISAPVLFYFNRHHALTDLWNAYFFNNLFVYGKTSSFSSMIKGLMSGAASMLTYNDTTVLLILFSLITLWRDGRRNISVYVFLTFVFSFGLIYAGGINQKYYSEILCIFVPIGLAQLWNRTNLLSLEPIQQRVTHILLPLLFVAALFGNENREMLFQPRSEMPQYIFKETLQEHPGATLFNYGALDIGLYTTADIVPSTRYFCMLNLPSEEMIIEVEHYMADGVTDFIVSRELTVDSPCYRLIQSTDYPDSGKWYTYYLYERQ